MSEGFKRNKSFVILVSLIVVVMLFLFYTFYSRSFADFDHPFVRKTLFSKLGIDEEAYGNTVFDASRFDFRMILDKDVLVSDHVISISFRVGGNEENDAVDPVYDIALEDLVVDCDLLSPYVKWKLFKNGTEISSGSLDYHFDTIRDGRLVLTPIQQDLVSYQEDKNLYDFYQFYLWLSDSCQEEDITKCSGSIVQNNLLGKRISGKIEVELYSKTKVALVRNPSDELDTNSCVVSE